MQEVGCGVVEGRLPPPNGIDLGPERSGQVAGQAVGDVEDELVLLAGRQDGGRIALGIHELPRIAHLSAAFGVERGQVEYQLVPGFVLDLDFAVAGDADLG